MIERESPARSERYFERLTLSQRIQHIVMMVSFFTLVITGLPVLFPEAPASAKVISFVGGFGTRAILHRVAAIVLMGVCAYHALWTLFSRIGHSEFLALMPEKRDIYNAIHMLKYFFSLAPDEPKFDRFNYVEKFEYLALAWGSAVMIGTGLILWFEEEAMLVLPKWTLDVATVVHSYEAVLAFLAIIIWHFYHVHLNPEVFPMSKVWLTGNISESEMKEHHPLEYARIVRSWPLSLEPEPEKEQAEVRAEKISNGG